MNNRPIIRCSTFALAAVCSTLALSVANAQSTNSTEQPPKSDRKAPATTNPLVLPPITVSAGSDTRAPYQTPGGVSVVDGKIVQEKYGGDANAIVRGMPGTFTRISSSQPGVSPTSAASKPTAYSPAVSGEMGEKTGRGRAITLGLTTQF